MSHLPRGSLPGSGRFSRVCVAPSEGVVGRSDLAFGTPCVTARIGSFNLGSMANALPQALGAQALDRSRRVVLLSGDGGLMMLLGDLRTAVAYRLPLVVVVCDNGSLGMAQLEQQERGLASFGTGLDNPDLAAVAAAMGLEGRRVEDPDDLDGALEWAFSQDGPVLLDVVTNPDEIAVPPHPKVSQAWGYAVAKLTEAGESR